MTLKLAITATSAVEATGYTPLAGRTGVTCVSFPCEVTATWDAAAQAYKLEYQIAVAGTFQLSLELNAISAAAPARH
eukprot:4929119-Pyramimonas_sp.AAC.1